MDSKMEIGDPEEERTALGRLKGTGAQRKVGTIRTGDVKQGKFSISISHLLKECTSLY